MKIEDIGVNNKIVGGEFVENVTIKIKGNNNSIFFEENVRISSGEWFINGDNNELKFGEHVRCGHLKIIIQDASRIVIGKNSTIEQAYLLARDGCQIIFGVDCMISFQVDFRTSDAHSIWSIETGELLNPAGDIILGDHVWIAQGAIVSKNVYISSGSVIGSRSFVQNMTIPPNSIFAGTPARLINTGIEWSRSMSRPAHLNKAN